VTIGRLLAAVVLAGALAACSGSQSGAGQGRGSGTTVVANGIDEVLAAHRDTLLALPGVVGTAIGLCDGERCIKVFLADADSPAAGSIPPHLDGYRVVVEVTGTVRPR
jgi:hypothetical protein